MRKIYALEFVERDGIGERVIFTKPFPNIPNDTRRPVKTRDALERRVTRAKSLSELDKQVILTGISFAIDMWFPKNFYRVTLVDWKYD